MASVRLKSGYESKNTVNLKDYDPQSANFSVKVKATDHVGNSTTREVARFSIKSKEEMKEAVEAAPKYIGKISGEVQLATSGKRHSSNNDKNKVALLEGEKVIAEAALNDGRFEFENVETGKLHLKAHVETAENKYDKEQPLELKTRTTIQADRH